MVDKGALELEGFTVTLDRTVRYYFWFSFPGVCPLGSRRRMS
jgi:hypothetical protein